MKETAESATCATRASNLASMAVMTAGAFQTEPLGEEYGSAPDHEVQEEADVQEELQKLRQQLAEQMVRRRFAEAQRDQLQQELESVLQVYAKARQELEMVKASRAYRLYRETALRLRRNR